MKKEIWAEVEKLYHAALELPPNERQAYLDSVDPANTEVLREVSALLSYDRQASDFIEKPAIEVIASRTAPSPAQPQELRQISGYQLVAPIGKGGMSEVYLARDPSLNRNVALKILPQELTEDPDRIKRLRIEARAMSSLNHPNIVTVYEVGSDSGLHYIAEEFVEGRTLRLRLNESESEKVPLIEAVEIGCQIAEALAVAHEAGVTHRDIKPENIIIRPDGIVKVLDFGLAKMSDSVPAESGEGDVTESKVTTDPGLVIGTPRYMSPEQARGLKVDPRTDIFSLGVVLYEMITGRPPFDGVNSLDVIGAILNRDPLPLSDLPAELESLILKCLEKERNDRYQSARDIALELRRLKVGLQTGEIAPTSPSDLKARKRLPIVIAIGAVLLIIGTIATWFVAGRKSTGGEEIRTLAVLPLELIGDDPAKNYLGLGIADAIITKISRINGLIVRPTSAVQGYSRKRIDALQAAREQRVEAVLDGTFQQEGDHWRVGFNLIRTVDGASLWSDRFDISQTDIFSMQDKVVRQIVQRLHYRLSPSEQKLIAKKHTANPEAYDNYLKAAYHFNDHRNFWWERRETDQAIVLLKKAIEIDPGYAQAHILLGSCYAVVANWYEDNAELIRQAQAELDVAAKADPQLETIPLLKIALLNSHYYGYHFYDMLKELRRAKQAGIKIGPGMHAGIYQHLGFPESYDQFERAIELEPASDGIKNGLIANYLIDINPEGALATMKRFSLGPKWPYYAGVFTWANLDLNRPGVAAPFVAGIYKAGRDAVNFHGLELALNGKFREAEATVNEEWQLKKIPPVFHPSYHHFAHNAARIYALQGKAEEAVKWLRVTAHEGFPNYPAFSRDPYLNGIRKDPVFIRFMTELKSEWDGYRSLITKD